MPPRSRIDFASLRERTVTLDEGRAVAVAANVRDRHARHVVRARLASVGAGVATLMGVAVLAWVVVVHRRPAPLVETQATASAGGPAAIASSFTAAGGDLGGIVLADGSRVTFLVAGTQLAQSGTKGRQATLVRGSARFDVVHDIDTPFRVTAGSILVEDVGTVFTVRLGDDGAATVAVESGAVSVRGPSGETTLQAGASGSFPIPAASTAPSPSAAPHSPSWKKLAQAGDYDSAYAIIQDPGTTVRDDPEELLLAADAARLSGHADRAVPMLRRMVAKYPGDSRAGLAAFTLGRVLLDDLGQARDAAGAFATAYDHGGPLAEDALAREVEAWSRAGDRAQTKAVAARYLAMYPTGRRAALVRRLSEQP